MSVKPLFRKGDRCLYDGEKASPPLKGTIVTIIKSYAYTGRSRFYYIEEADNIYPAECRLKLIEEKGKTTCRTCSSVCKSDEPCELYRV